jgi:hypothetical protein
VPADELVDAFRGLVAVTSSASQPGGNVEQGSAQDGRAGQSTSRQPRLPVHVEKIGTGALPADLVHYLGIEVLPWPPLVRRKSRGLDRRRCARCSGPEPQHIC